MTYLTLRVNAILIATAVFAADQWTKTLVLNLAERGEIPKSLTSFLNIILAGNLGVSFGLFHAHNAMGVWILLGIATLLSCLLLYWLCQAKNKGTIIALGLMLGGAAGNILDRYQFGKVVDFIDLHALGYHWYTFNIADCGVVIGAALYIFDEFYLSTKLKK